jgi:hypothetical protein
MYLPAHNPIPLLPIFELKGRCELKGRRELKGWREESSTRPNPIPLLPILEPAEGCDQKRLYRRSPYRSQCLSGMASGSLYQYQTHGSWSKSSGGSLG